MMKTHQRVPFIQLIIGLLAHLNQAQTINNDLFRFPFTRPAINNFAGYHIKACCFEVPRQLNIQRNATGSIISLSGITPEMLIWLSRALNFTYECVMSPQSMRHTFQKTSAGGRGFDQMLKMDMCDLIVGPVAIVYDEGHNYDILGPYMISPTKMMIPKPVASFSNLEAIWKPFKPAIWLVLLVLLPSTTLVLVILHHCNTNNQNSAPRNMYYLIGQYGLFTFHIITLQGGYNIYSKTLKTRMVIGAWCLMCFVLVTYYSSVLISLLMVPHYQPLIDNVQDLANNKKDINPVVVSGLGVDIHISMIFTDPVAKKLKQKIDADPKTRRCPNSTACLQLVKQGSNVYIDTRSQLILAMDKDYANTGQCNVAFARDKFPIVLQLIWGIRYNDHHKESLNLGMLRMVESGLIDWWDRRTAGSGRCVMKESHFHAASTMDFTRLTLPNLQGPFVILLSGFALAMLTWVGEKIVFWIGLILATLAWMREPIVFNG